MPLRKWDPYRVLNITSRDSDSMFCTGQAVSRGNARCRWKIPRGDFETIRDMLDKMESKPPNEVFDMLPRLARLSLCEEQHKSNKGQREGVVAMWADALEDVVEEYDKAKKLKKRNQSLENELAKETEERKRLEALLSKDSKGSEHCECEEVRAQIEELKAAALDDSKQHKTELVKAEEDRTALSLKLDKLRKSFDKRAQESERMKTLMAEQKAEMSRQLAAEQKASEEYKTDAEASRAVVENKSKLIENLQSDLSKERQVSTRLQGELVGANIEQGFLSSQIAELLPQLAAASQASEQLKEEVNEGVTNRKALIQQVETLQSQFSTEQQNSCKLKENLQEIEKSKATLSSQLAIERQDKEGLDREVRDTRAREATLKTQLEDIQGVLERIRLDLTRNRQTNEEQRATSDAREAASAAETARMIEQIRELEMEASAGCLSTFRAKFKRLGKRSQP
jgi:hypothetical protein